LRGRHAIVQPLIIRPRCLGGKVVRFFEWLRSALQPVDLRALSPVEPFEPYGALDTKWTRAGDVRGGV